MNFLRGDSRRHLLGTLQGAAPAAASFFGFRIGRNLILRISALLALRTLVSSVQLPLDSGVISYAWSFLFTTVQASVAMAAAANIFDLGGLLGYIGSRLFGTSSDMAFVTLYGSAVLMLGPLCGMVEAAVMTFEIMRMSRSVTEKMFASEVRGEGKLIRYLLICTMAITAALSLGVIYVVGLVYERTVPIAMMTILVLLYTICLTHNEGQLLEACILGLFSCLTMALGVIEEFDSPTMILNQFLVGAAGTQPSPSFNLFGVTYSLQSPEARALILLYSSAVLLVAMSRAPRFVRLVQIGAVAMEQEENTTQGQMTPDSAATVEAEPDGFLKGILNTVVLAALTFRILVWTGEIRTGEYLPGLCRAVQVATIVFLYRVYLGSGDDEQQSQVPAVEPVRDIAGNIIENPK